MKLMQRLIWAVLGFWIVQSLATGLYDADLWWHLATGRSLWENRVFLRTDVFSHTLYGSPWINFEWLGEIIFYGVVKYFGLTGLYVLKIFLSLGVLGLLIGVLRQAGARGAGLSIATLLGFLILRPRLNERIEVFSFIFLLLMIQMVLLAENPAHKIRRFLPWIIFGLTAVWCNLHGGFIFGLGFLGLATLGSFWSKEERDYRRLLSWSFFLCLLGSFLNPYGPHLYQAFFEHMEQLRGNIEIIEEWAPSSLTSAPVYWSFFIAASAVFVYRLLENLKEAKQWGPVIVVFLLWSSQAQRNSALAGLLVLPFIVVLIAQHTSLLRWSAQRRVGPALQIIIFASFLSQARVWARSWPSEKVRWHRFPVQACEYLRQNHFKGKLYNTYEFGGYIEWSLGDQFPVFMDGRYLFQPLLSSIDQMNAEVFTNPQSKVWKNYLEKENISLALTNLGNFTIPAGRGGIPYEYSGLDVQFPRSDWALVFWDDTACVFLRRNPENASWLKKNEFETLWPYNFFQTFFRIEQGVIRLDDVARELERHKKTISYSVVRTELEKQLYAR